MEVLSANNVYHMQVWYWSSAGVILGTFIPRILASVSPVSRDAQDVMQQTTAISVFSMLAMWMDHASAMMDITMILPATSAGVVQRPAQLALDQHRTIVLSQRTYRAPPAASVIRAYRASPALKTP